MLMVVDERYDLLFKQVLSIGRPTGSSRQRDQQQYRRQYTHALSSGFAEQSVARREGSNTGGPQPTLSTTFGSSRDARSAGRRHATAATRITSATTPIIVTASA